VPGSTERLTFLTTDAVSGTRVLLKEVWGETDWAILRFPGVPCKTPLFFGLLELWSLTNSIIYHPLSTISEAIKTENVSIIQ